MKAVGIYTLQMVSGLLLVTFLIAPVVSSSPCILVEKFVFQRFNENISLLRRGLSNKIVENIHCSVTKDLIKRINGIYGDDHSFGSVCLASEDERELLEIHRRKQTKFLGKSKTLSMFYLPDEEYPTIQNMSSCQDDAVHRVWIGVLNSMMNTPKVVSNEEICKLPNGLQLFYDPAERKTKEQFNRFVHSGKNLVAASDQLYKVLGLAMRLKVLQIPDDKSKQLVAHCVAYIFNSIRANRLEGEELFVTNAYMLIYEAIFAKWTSGKDLSIAPPIDPAVIENRIGRQVRQLLSFYGWGRLEVIEEGSNDLVKHSLWNNIMDSSQIDHIMKDMERHAENKQSFRISTPLRTRKLHVRNVISNSETCNAYPHFWYYQNAGSAAGSTPQSKCCGEVCRSIDAEMAIDTVTIGECCNTCNLENLCIDAAELQWMQNIITIRSYEYGNYIQSAVTIIV